MGSVRLTNRTVSTERKLVRFYRLDQNIILTITVNAATSSNKLLSPIRQLFEAVRICSTDLLVQQSAPTGTPSVQCALI